MPTAPRFPLTVSPTLQQRILASRARVVGGLLGFLSSSVRHLPVPTPRVPGAVRQPVRYRMDICFELF